jgi:hypothetical protein
MVIYLDMCCLKRPFDDQSQPRIRLETEAVLGLLAIESDAVQFVRSPALMLENATNPIRERAARVDQWLTQKNLWQPNAQPLVVRTAALIALGFKNFGALHVACAEQAKADVLATVDDRLLAAAKRNAAAIALRVESVATVAQEVLK